MADKLSVMNLSMLDSHALLLPTLNPSFIGTQTSIMVMVPWGPAHSSSTLAVEETKISLTQKLHVNVPVCLQVEVDQTLKTVVSIN